MDQKKGPCLVALGEVEMTKPEAGRHTVFGGVKSVLSEEPCGSFLSIRRFGVVFSWIQWQKDGRTVSVSIPSVFSFRS